MLSWPWPKLKGCKGHRVQHWTLAKYWCGELSCRVLKGSKHSLKGYHANNISWTWPSLKGHKGNRKVNIKIIWDIDVENIL